MKGFHVYQIGNIIVFYEKRLLSDVFEKIAVLPYLPYCLLVGIWDVMSNQEVVDFVRMRIAKQLTPEQVLSESFCFRLTYFSPMIHFYTPRKCQKTKVFRTFSGGMEMEY